jgi:hypothetical protein
MPMQQLALIANLLNMTKTDWVLLTVAASLVLAPGSRVETTWDMANRVCDRYFSDAPGQNGPVRNQAT